MLHDNLLSGGFISVNLIFFVIACVMISKKNRSFWYIVLSFFFPLVGMIVSLCLEKRSSRG